MNCDEILDLISASLDGELTAQQEAEVQSHLAQCPSCRALMVELTAIHDGCGSLDVTPPPELAQRILDNLPSQKVVKPTKVIYWKRWGAMAAAVCLIALAAWRIPELLERGDVPQAASGDRSGSVSATVSFDQDAPETAFANEGQPDPASSMPPYVNGEAFSANTGLPASDSSEDEEVVMGENLQRSTEVTKGVTGYGDAVMDAAAPEDSQPTAKMAAPAPAYFSYTATGAADALPAQESGPEQPQAAPTLVRSALIQTNSDSDMAMDAAVAEFPPATGSGEENIAVEPFEELYALTVSAPDSSQIYCGVLTMAQGAPIGNYPVERQADGQLWYLLPAADFNALLQELDSQNISYDLRQTGLDISPTAQQGLLIIEG